MRIPLAGLLVAGLSLSACAYGGYYGGGGLGYGYSPYYSSGYSPYYGYGYRSSYRTSSSPYWGWNNGYYYPGSGYYVYDSYRRPFRWSSSQQRYWTVQRSRALSSGRNVVIRENWTDFNRGKAKGQNRMNRRQYRQD